MKKILKKISASLLVVIMLLGFGVLPALADLDWPSPSDAAQEGASGITSKYGISDNALVENAQLLNVARLKKQAPQTSILFEPANPKPGERVTATAQAMYFGNSSVDKLYYTWFLRHADQKEGDDLDLYKEQAMQMIANGGFDWEKEAYNSDTDDDGYKASFGGDDQKEVGDKDEKHCFFHDNDKGAEYEFKECEHLFPNAPGEKTGDGSFGKSEEQFWHTNPNDPDTPDFGAPDEAIVAGLGQKVFTWNYQEGDQLGVAIEGISNEPTSYDDASYKVMWALSKNKCDKIGDAFRNPEEDGEEVVEVSPSIWPSAYGQTFTRTVKKTTTTYEQAEYSSYRISKTKTETKTEQIYLNPLTSTTGGSATATGGDTPTASVDITTETEEAPEAPENETCYAIDGISSESGVTDRSCCPSGSDACSVLSSRTETTYPEKELDMSQEDKDKNLFKMTMDDFDKCLLDNFVDPTEGGGKYEKMDVQLSYDPKNPINDTEGSNADQLNIHSTVSNSDDAEFLYYQWEIYSTNQENPPASLSGWDQLSKGDLPDSTPTTGIGNKDLQFTLSIPDAKFLKVKLSVSENAYNGSKKGNNEITIPLVSNSNRIKVFSASVSDDLRLSTPSEEKCTTGGSPDPICKVAKNQIIGVKVEGSDLDNFYWTINNQSLSYNYNSSMESAPNPAYFPITEEKGQQIIIALTATNKDTGEKVNLSRTLEVSDPDIIISSEDAGTASPILRGYYTDTDDKEWPDYYENKFQALHNGEVKLTANFTGAEPSDPSQISWYLDGYLVSTGRDLSFTADKDNGQIYSVAVSYPYTPDNNTAKALDQFWGVSTSAFFEKDISATIDLTVASSLEEMANSQNKRILASLITSVPGYLGFLLRILLTTALMIFSAKIVFSLSLGNRNPSIENR